MDGELNYALTRAEENILRLKEVYLNDPVLVHRVVRAMQPLIAFVERDEASAAVNSDIVAAIVAALNEAAIFARLYVTEACEVIGCRDHSLDELTVSNPPICTIFRAYSSLREHDSRMVDELRCLEYCVRDVYYAHSERIFWRRASRERRAALSRSNVHADATLEQLWLLLSLTEHDFPVALIAAAVYVTDALLARDGTVAHQHLNTSVHFLRSFQHECQRIWTDDVRPTWWPMRRYLLRLCGTAYGTVRVKTYKEERACVSVPD